MLRRGEVAESRQARPAVSPAGGAPRCPKLALFLLAGVLQGAILPDHIGPAQRTSDQPAQFPADHAIQHEYGLAAAEQAAYGPLSLTAYQFGDPTGAFAASQVLGPTAILDGNYVLTCSGHCPPPRDLPGLVGSLPKLYRGPYPMLSGWLPKSGLVPGSARYVLGPASLAAFAAPVPASAAAFQFSTEAEVARYRRNGIENTLVLFSYPSPGIARQQMAQLAKVSGVTVRRNGPLVAVVLESSDSKSAQQLLDAIGYSAAVTENQPIPLKISPQSAVRMVLAGFQLAGILLVFCLFSGLLFGFIRVVSRRLGAADAGEAIVALHLSDK